MILGLVEHSASNGDYLKDPLCFKNFGLNYLCVYLNNKPFPALPWTPDFSNDSYEREYFDYFNEQCLTSGIGVSDITYKLFKSHYCLYVINFNQDFSNSISDYICLSREGNIRIEIKFSADLNTALKLICVGRIDSNIEIDKNRNVLIDY